MNVVNAATLPTHTGSYYRKTNAYHHNSNTRRYTRQNDNSHPTRFYISAKGGYNLMFGSTDTRERGGSAAGQRAVGRAGTGCYGTDAPDRHR